MKELTKREKIINTLEGKKTGYIPVIPSATTFALARSPHSPEDCKKDSRKFADAMVSARKEFNYDGLWAGLFQGVTSFLGGGLIDKHGKKSVSGNGTVRQPEDMKKLRPFHVDLCEALHHIMENIALLKKLEPAEPVLVIVDNPSMVAAALMDEENYYFNLIKNPAFIRDLTELVFDPLLLCVKKIIEAGADIIWLPLPSIGGTCISRQHYETFCMPYNKRFNEAIIAQGAHLIVHTCGNWNDRFDLVTTEGAHCLHVSQADLGELKKNYGKKVALMGQVPSISVMMLGDADLVLKTGIQDCLQGAENGGFILSADCGLPGKTPEENIRALVRAAREAEQLLSGKC
ncbi:MAG: uroporphyrinogen decarboxylase family protein [Bacillota bacterium]